jgi:hypothetical protein
VVAKVRDGRVVAEDIRVGSRGRIARGEQHASDAREQGRHRVVPIARAAQCEQDYRTRVVVEETRNERGGSSEK